jgi:hypothetical protein
MIPVFQKHTVANDGFGDCWNACIASILEYPLREVAPIYPNCDGDYHALWRVWLAEFGHELEYHKADAPPNGYSIASVYTNRIFPVDHPKAGERISHACVAFNGLIVHDPYPIPGKIRYDIQHFQSLVPLDAVDQRYHAIRRAGGVCLHGYIFECGVCL